MPSHLLKTENETDTNFKKAVEVQALTAPILQLAPTKNIADILPCSLFS
jgi:hypothetical protein